MIQLKQQEIFSNYHIAETVLNNNQLTFEHSHDFYEIFLITDGQLKHLINGNHHILDTNTLSIIYPSDQHHFQRYSSIETHFINLAFPTQIFDQALALYQSFYKQPLPSFHGKSIGLPLGLRQSIQSKIIYLYRDVSPLSTLSKNDILISIILDALISFHNVSNYEHVPIPWLTFACEQMRIRDNYLLGLPRFIELSGKSQEHLTRMMKKHFQMTPTAYINNVKLAHAATLLSTTQKSILDIIYESGYENVPYFNHLFKQEYGLTPRQFRYINNRIINPSE